MHLPMAPGATMPGADAPRQPMPIACDEKRSLPDARRAVAERTPKGNKNALKHGRYTAQAMERRREIAALLRAMRALAGSH